MLFHCFHSVTVLHELQHHYLSSRVDFQHFLRFVLASLKGEQLVFVSLQLLLLQSDHNTPTGRGSSAPQQTDRLGHGYRHNRKEKPITQNEMTKRWSVCSSCEIYGTSIIQRSVSNCSPALFDCVFKGSEVKDVKTLTSTFHSVGFVFFYCRTCIHSISSERVRNQSFYVFWCSSHLLLR